MRLAYSAGRLFGTVVGITAKWVITLTDRVVSMTTSGHTKPRTSDAGTSDGGITSRDAVEWVRNHSAPRDSPESSWGRIAARDFTNGQPTWLVVYGETAGRPITTRVLEVNSLDADYEIIAVTSGGIPRQVWEQENRD